MINLNKKQKIITGILSVIIMACLGYYVYSKDNSNIIIEQEENIITEQEKQEKESKETEKQVEKQIFIHISGAVNQEGVISLNENSRISDAIEKAGGLKEDANIKDINLAYKLEDGMKIYIPTNQEKEEKEKNNVESITSQASATSQTDNTEEYVITSKTKEENTNQTTLKTAKVNINTASQTELETLPGIGPSTALKIINYRTENGKFKTIENIKEVSGIGDAKYEKIKSLITV